MGLALNSNCSFKMTTKITFGPFLHAKLFKFWLRIDFKSIYWPILKWECFEVKFSKLKNANQPIFLKIQIFEGIKLKMAENVHFYDWLMITKWFLGLFHFQGCYCGFLFSNLRPILELNLIEWSSSYGYEMNSQSNYCFSFMQNYFEVSYLNCC